MKNIRQAVFALGILMVCLYGHAQNGDSLQSALRAGKYLEKVDKKTAAFNSSVDDYTAKSLQRIRKQEIRMQRKLAKTDSLLSKKLFAYSIDSLQKLQASIKNKAAKISRLPGGKYFPFLDTLKQSLSFLGKSDQYFKSANAVKGNVSSAMDGVTALEGKMESVENIQQFLKERESVLNEQLKSFPQLSKYVTRINKETYYYKEQINTYKDVLSDESKTEKVMMNMLREQPAFKQLMQNNSQLAGLFASPPGFPAMPGGGGTSPVVNGLPSRAAVQQFVQGALPAVDLSAQVRQMQQQIPDTKSALGKLVDKLNNAGGMGDTKMPDFKPNTQRTKPFAKRLEYGTDLQFGKSVNYIPATATIGLKLGYKLNDKTSAGIGASYILGLGNGWNHIRFSNEGLGFRTYIKWRLLKGLDIQGGSEWNYMLRFNNIEELKTIKAWQQSALLGLSKDYKVGKKVKGSVQVLYDFLYHNHLPVTQPVVFRFGYGF